MSATGRKTFAKIDDTQAAAAWGHVQGMKAFGYKEVSALTRVTIERATRIVRHWDASGALVQLQSRTGKQRALWQIKPGTERPTAPTPRMAEDNVWTSMRHLGVFSPTDLVAHSATDQVEVSNDGASAYCRALLSAGYLRVVTKATPGVREARYRLINNTGPSAPRIRRVRALVDFNTEAVMVLSEVGQ